MKVKMESEKVGLKLHIQKTELMTSISITLWQMDGENCNTDRLYFLGLQNHCEGGSSQEIKRHLLAPWKKSYDQPRQHIKKQGLLCQQRSVQSNLWFFQ